uniref:Reverse transcriptase domain-containing protein n=1 Tax=Latimeria chalumnae TaxID=7897 RepID=H3AH86_LATCH
GRTQFCFHNWEKVTGDPWVLDTVQGYRLELVSHPVQDSWPWELRFSLDKEALIQQELDKLVQKQVISPVNSDVGPGFISTIFLVPNPIINLRALNKFIAFHHFKMEGLHLLRDTLQLGDWMVCLDLKDVYFMIPIHPEDRKWLRFLG